MVDSGALPAGRRAKVAIGLVAGIPILVAIIHGIAVGWVPYGDDGTIATRALDVFTTDTPLTGVYSQASSVSAQALHSPGPMLYWLLAIPARFLPPVALTVIVGLVNLLCLTGAVALAGRRGGNGLLLAGALALAVMLNALPALSLHDIWNPSAGLLPLTALIFVSWSVACGDTRLLPVMALIASYTMQSHLAFVLPSLAVVLVALAGVALQRPPGASRWLLAGVAVALACWSFPIADELSRHPGNLTALARAGGDHGPTLGVAAGWHAVIRAVGIPPWWLRDSQSFAARIHDLTTAPGWLATVSAVATLALTLAVGVVGFRRGRPDVGTAQALSLMLCLALAGVVAVGSRGMAIETNGYLSWWGAVAGMWTWLALGWGLVVVMAPSALTPVGPRALALAAVALLIGVVTLESVKGRPDPDQRLYGPLREIASRLPGDVRRGTTRVEACLSGLLILNAAELGPGVMYAVHRDGAQVVTELAPQLSDRYQVGGHRYGAYLDIVGSSASMSGHVVARVSAASAASPTSQRFKVLSLHADRAPCPSAS